MKSGCLVILLVILLLFTTAGTAVQSQSEHSASSSSAGNAEAQQTIEVDDPDIEDEASTDARYYGGFPNITLKESEIGETYFGEPTKVEENVEFTTRFGSTMVGTRYSWEAHNGSGDEVYAVYYVNGRLVWGEKLNTDKDYWPSSVGLPNLDAPGNVKEQESDTETSSGIEDLESYYEDMYYEFGEEYVDLVVEQE